MDFTYAPMTSTEYYDNFTSHDQNLVDTLYLDSIKIKGDDQLYKQIIFSDNTSDILNLGIVKRYLTELTIEMLSQISLKLVDKKKAQGEVNSENNNSYSLNSEGYKRHGQEEGSTPER